MAYLSKETILWSYSQLSKLTNDPSAQGATQVTSILRYMLALDAFVKEFNHDCDTTSKSDKDTFIQFVGDVVKVNDKSYTTNFHQGIKEVADYGVGSNFFSVGAVRKSVVSPTILYNFPQRSSWPPIFNIQNGVLIRNEQFISNLSSYLSYILLRISFALWLVRFSPIKRDNLAESIRDNLKQRYSEDVVNILLPVDADLNNYPISVSDNVAILVESDFPKAEEKPQPITNVSLYPPEKLSDLVKRGFLKFWQIIDQHGADHNSYIKKFENAINPYLEKLDFGVDSVFQITGFRNYDSIIEEICKEFPETEYITKGRNNSGDRYEAASTHLHFRNYLQILAYSDFTENTRKQREEFNESNLSMPELRQRQVIYFGAPGTGKSREVKTLADRLAKGRTIRTTFHPDTDYSSFVGCFKPKMNGKDIEYRFVPQAFSHAYVNAWKDRSKPYFLIIEEINRGNCAQIFGDIFQLLDREITGESCYSIQPDSDLQEYIKSQLVDVPNIPFDIANGIEMALPANLFIYATMNTYDQSLFPIDSAFKRRWDMRYTAIKPGERNHILSVNGSLYSWTSFIENVNKKIFDLTKSEDKQLGYWFIKPDDNGYIDWELFVSKAVFYIWNDVVKDYATMEKEDSPFSKKFSFTKFFDAHGKPLAEIVIQFLDALKVDKISVASNAYQTIDEDPDAELASEPSATYQASESTSSNGRHKVSVGDETVYLRRTFFEITRQALSSNHMLNLNSLREFADAAGFVPPQRGNLFLLTSEIPHYMAEHSSDSTAKDRYYFKESDYLSDSDGTQFVVYAQWSKTPAVVKALNNYAKSLDISLNLD